METELKFGEEKITLNDYIHKTIKECRETKNKVKNELIQYKNKLDSQCKKTKRNTIIVGLVIIIIVSMFVGFTIMTIVAMLNQNEQKELDLKSEQLTVRENELNSKEQDLKILEEKYNELIQKFEQVGELTYENTVFNDSLYEIEKLTLNNSKTKKNVVEFACRLYSTQKEYKIVLNDNTKINVMLINGQLKEYDLDISYQMYQNEKVMPRKNELSDPNLYLQELSGINKEEIKWMKLSNVSIRKYNLSNWTINEIVEENFEIEIYKK